MKKQILLLLVCLPFCFLALSQDITGLEKADLRSISGRELTLTWVRNGNQLKVSGQETGRGFTSERDSFNIRSRIIMDFKGNTQNEFKSFVGIEPGSELTLEMVDEKTGKTVASINGRDNFNVISKKTGHSYRFVLNGRIIATGYTP